MHDKKTKIFELNKIRQKASLVAPMVDFDANFTFYYDETNNIRKFYVRETDFNESFTANFVLGGLIHEGSAPDVQSLITSLKLQKTVREIKLKHLASGDFLDCLKSNKLKTYLQFIKDGDLYVHYSSTNILYWSIVDIVDSAIVNSKAAMALGLDFSNFLKNNLYKLCRLEIASVISLFYKYGYPNIKSNSILLFIEDLTNLFDGYIDTAEFHLGLESLRQILKQARKKGSLPFIMDEEDHLLLKDLSDFYLRPICMFKNSAHIFDNEDLISEIFSDYRLFDGKREVRNYTFVDSQSNVLVQLSDVFIGLMGKLANYINTSSMRKIETDLNTLSQIQKDNLELLKNVISKSLDKNIGFIHRIDSFEELSKTDFLLG